MSGFFMITYDIEEDRSRRAIAKILKNHGIRVQYSVFECFITERQYDSLRKALQKHIGPRDSIRYYPLCSWCREEVILHGPGVLADDEGFVLI
ncbi:CRISPR-associated endonuclease Cas2 [Desulfosarcina sp. OttesenSCG-928-G17]|nr:CRISPR-associated endonuclease Cas2 [Desulfosarcina sp. OttesenSCG-928-G17]